MSLVYTLLLLAASSTSAVGGPVPQNARRQLSTKYSNTTAVTSCLAEAPKSILSAIVQGDITLVIEPLERTVITQVQPAVTFFDTKGNPLATKDVQTVLLTSYFTPTPVSASLTTSATASSVAAPSPLTPVSQAMIGSGILKSASNTSGFLITRNDQQSVH
ncbi:hypothetical protein ACEQ8H_001089 [Pleosporales sp. CAS-2024a]